MKKTTFLLAIISLFAIANVNAATLPTKAEETTTNYTVNDAEIEALFANSTELSMDAINESNSTANLFAPNANNNNNFKKAAGKSAIAAIVIDFFVGGLGIHRAYLGTKTFTWIGYILTCGGIGGIVPFVDLIVLIVNFNDISKFEGNPKFFMW
jgi:TM2 domain-containing membrane protein YozV